MQLRHIKPLYIALEFIDYEINNEFTVLVLYTEELRTIFNVHIFFIHFLNVRRKYVNSFLLQRGIAGLRGGG